MKDWNIVLAGVGGQGLVTSTKIICDAAWNDGRDVKSNDVIGLAQRGGKVWGSVRIGKKIYAPDIIPGTADMLIGLEPLEALRWSYMLNSGGTVYMNTEIVLPVPVVHEMDEYPENIPETLGENFRVLDIDASEVARKLGNAKAANSVLLGMASAEMDLAIESWTDSIRSNVPQKFLELNLEAFEIGRKEVRRD